MHRPHFGALAITLLCLWSCDRPHASRGEQLARRHCGACHAFPDAALLDKATWMESVLPQMAPRLGIRAPTLFEEVSRSPHMAVLPDAVPEADWNRIVAYYRDAAPATLPAQALRAEPGIDPDLFLTGPLTPRAQSSGIITLLEADSVDGRVFIGEAGTNRIRVFDRSRRLLSSLSLGSPPTGLVVDRDQVLVLESGVLQPNDEPRGRLVRYRPAGRGSFDAGEVLIDSLFRPVFVQRVDVDSDGRDDFVIAEYGNNVGRLALYRAGATGYERHVLDPGAGAIRAEMHDLTGDGSPDIVALFGQGDERIVLFPNDGDGSFSRPGRTLARFPPVYGSMYFTMRDCNADGRLDIVYVNGDNFDYSRVLKPYHGIRILENGGDATFRERFFFPVNGAARAEVADFDKDGDLDILATSNFADREGHPERGIMFLTNAGGYDFRPYAFSIASTNRWNLTATADLNEDGWLDVIVGAMNLESIENLQRGATGRTAEGHPALLFENRMHRRARATTTAR
jgi:hypothetical protein